MNILLCSLAGEALTLVPAIRDKGDDCIVWIKDKSSQAVGDGLVWKTSDPDSLADQADLIVFTENSMGTIADVTLRILIGGIDDQYLTGRMAQWDQNESAFVLLTAMFVKRVGDGAGNVTTKIYNMTGGIFRRGVPAKTVSEADVEQSVAVYNMRFLCPPPSIQG